jgi:hypothetical protein
MARRVFLHVGPPKTGTSFLQAAWWQHRRQMADQGVLFPGASPVDHFRAAAVLANKRKITRHMTAAGLESWDRLTAEVAAWDGDAVLSSEHFAVASRPNAARGLLRLAEVADEVHVVATARDLARQVAAAWQQSVKQGKHHTFEEYWRELAADPRHGFWKLQDLPRVTRRWSQGLPSERLHLVVHGRPGSPRNLLWDRMSGLLGIDPAILEPVSRTNDSLGITHVELLRRVHGALAPDGPALELSRLSKSYLTQQILVPAGRSDSFVLPPAAHAWAVERGTAMVERLRKRGYDVVGDLDDLTPDPAPPTGRTPDQVSEAEVADLASTALARVLERELASRRSRQRLQRQNRRLRQQLRERDAGRWSATRRARRVLGRGLARVRRAG